MANRVSERIYRVNVHKIRQLLAEKGTNLKQFEHDAGVGNGAIAKWERTDAKVDTLCRVAKGLGVKVDDLLERKTT